MKRALTIAALLLACVACDKAAPGGSTPTTGGGADIDQIESTLDAIESEMAGD
ncbi:hypothetical protein [Actinokineospora sp. HUAS TT18]|uniref:hypothetical protein n=1 Tax=Actinokineospora sp. HUAS TT18 TaxID=3447451 RepID=UPI003F51FAA1